MEYWEKWRYKYLTGVALSFVAAAYLAGNQGFHDWLIHLGSLEYIGVLIAGFLFVSSFTVATSAVLIAILTENTHPLVIALIGGVGAVIGDLIIFRLVKNHLSDELALLVGKDGTRYLKHVFHSKYIAWTLPLIGAAIIASPLPDELGVSLLGLSKTSETKLIIISYISNVIGILVVASVVSVF